MSSGFVSEVELDERRKKRQEEWEKVRKPDEPQEVPEEQYDHRSLFDRLQEQKMKRDQEYEEAHKLKNMIKGLDDDEVEFLDLVDRTKIEEERKKWEEEKKEMQNFRSAVASLQESELEDRIRSEKIGLATETRKGPVQQPSVGVKKTSQLKLLAGAVKRKSDGGASVQPDIKKSCHSAGGQTAVNGRVLDIDKDAETSQKDKERGSEASDQKHEENLPKTKASQSGLQCVAILPGLGDYANSSDSDRSSDSDDELLEKHQYDLFGRRLVTAIKQVTSENHS